MKIESYGIDGVIGERVVRYKSGAIKEVYYNMKWVFAKKVEIKKVEKFRVFTCRTCGISYVVHQKLKHWEYRMMCRLKLFVCCECWDDLENGIEVEAE